MGNDGGSIPKRDDLVKTRVRTIKLDEQEKQSTKWRECSLSKRPLEEPIVSDKLGKLYNKSAMIEFLLDRSKFGQDGKQICKHIQNLKRDVKELKFSKDSNKKWICPISLKDFGIGVGIGGKFDLRWIYLTNCGCVLTETGLKQIGGTDCPVCGLKIDEMMTINPNSEEEEELKLKLVELLLRQNEEKEKRNLLRKEEKKRKKTNSKDDVEPDLEEKPKKQKSSDLPQSRVELPSSSIKATSMNKLANQIQQEAQQNLVKLSSTTLNSVYGPRDANGKQLLGQQKESWMTRGTWTRYAA
ncbi:hypothetical protein O181_007164 [Austropuccinia psidii MF-1]|uniref:Replication termination factor 2 n=1 Tax=Austropuccinia psidii MF-1 TaxID=1389203 RepID=A0A9Q3BLE9_9BASI|nr:hypothetical protein [Austropuccinia psidii MF-1]